jgi:hypothetical protein
MKQSQPTSIELRWLCPIRDSIWEMPCPPETIPPPENCLNPNEP